MPDLLQDLPLGKIRNFGGKLGLELQAMGCSTAGQARAGQSVDAAQTCMVVLRQLGLHLQCDQVLARPNMLPPAVWAGSL